MKKFFSIMLTLALSFALCVTAVADGELANGGELYQYWYSTYDSAADPSPYPDYVCGVWTESGDMFTQLTIMVTKDEAGETGKREILDMIADDSTVDFTYGSYTYAELRAAQREIGEIMEWLGFTGSAGWGVDERENVVYLDIDSTVPEAMKLIDECFSRFGPMFVVHDIQGFEIKFTSEELDGYLETGIIRGDGKGEGQGVSLVWLVVPALLLTMTAALMLLRRRSPRYAPAEGETDETLSPIETIVRDGSPTPSPELDSRILREIDKL